MYKRLRAFQTSLGETFISSREFKMLLLTNLVNIFHSPPYFEEYFVSNTTYYTTRYSMSTIMSNLMFLRFYLILRLIPNLSQWTDIHSEDCCE